MRTTFRALLLIGISVGLGMAIYILMGIQDQPLVNKPSELTPRDVKKVKEILKEHNPRKMKAGTIKTLSVRRDELELVANYLVNRFGRGGLRLELDRGWLAADVTVELPRNPLGRFLNLNVTMVEGDRLPRFMYVGIGRVSIPNWLANWLFTHALNAIYASDDDHRATDFIKRVAMTDSRLSVTYEWQPDLMDRVRARVISKHDQERLKAFHERLAGVSARPHVGPTMSLASLMRPLFELAHLRSPDGNPIADNRAAIMVLTAYVNGHGMSSIVPAAGEWPRPARRNVTLRGREDFAQHFITSAALAVTGGRPLSNVIGLYKEIDDSRNGSGFSFGDLAADRAGTRFGELATQSVQTARQVQKRLSGSLHETDFMPLVEDLPEFMSEAEFKRRFGSVGSLTYNRMMSEIERRIEACALYRRPGRADTQDSMRMPHVSQTLANRLKSPSLMGYGWPSSSQTSLMVSSLICERLARSARRNASRSSFSHR
ncbi:MAG: hypothetical protein ACE5MM_02135 [Nitrospiraceae bacterium]